MHNDLYKEQFLDTYRSKQNMRVLDKATVTVDKVNPNCGDKIKLQLQIEDGKIIDAAYSGEVCGVARVSASLLTEEIKGKSLGEVSKITEAELYSLVGFDLTSAREKCATLCLDALKEAIANVTR